MHCSVQCHLSALGPSAVLMGCLTFSACCCCLLRNAHTGMAFANAFLGVCHSMAHKLGGTHHVPHGLANAMLISHVIRYNATSVC